MPVNATFWRGEEWRRMTQTFYITSNGLLLH
jgi:hypothetical protein